MEEQKFLKRKKKAGTKKQLAEICHEFGDYYNSKGKYEKALEQYKECSKLYDQLQSRMESGQAHRMIGEMYMLLDKYEEALMHEDVYLSIARECKNMLEEQRALATLGRIHLVMGQCVKDKLTAMSSLKTAEKSFLKSIVICESLKGKINNYELMDMRARLLLNIGTVQQHLGNMEKALEYTQKAITICKMNDLYSMLNQCYIREGDFHVMNENLSKALLAFNLAYEVAGRLENKIAKQCEALSHKADTLCKMSDFYSAKSVLKKAWKLKTPEQTERNDIEKKLKIVVAMCYTEDLLLTTDSNDHKKFKKFYEKLGDGACSLNNFHKAVEYYHKMLEHAEMDGETDKQLLPIYVSLYQTYRDLEQYSKVLEYQRKEYEMIKDEPGEAYTTLMCMADTLTSLGDQDNHQQIVNTYLQARDMAERLDENKKRDVLRALIDYLKDKDTNVEAEQYKQELVALGGGEGGDTESEGEGGTSEDEESNKNTPNIGDEICLDDITDISDDENDEADKPRVARKRGKAFTIKKNAKGETQLHQACISGNVLLVTRLLSQGHPVNVRDNAGWLPLHEACIHGRRGVVEVLVGNGAALDDRGGAQCDGITPMQDAASNGFLEIVELLLDSGASPCIKNDHGDTVLDILRRWRKGERLSPTEEILYDTLCERIQKVLGKLGETPTKTPKKSTISCSGSSSKLSQEKDVSNRRRTNSLEKRRNIQLNDDEEDMSFALTIKARNRNIIDDNSSDSSHEYDSPKKSNAIKDYRNTMELLRNRNKGGVQNDVVRKKDFDKPRGGYLAPDEVDDDWLEDDVRSAQGKKRKRKESSEYNVTKDNSKGSQASPFKLTNENTPQKVTPIKNVVNNLGFLEHPPLNELFDSDSNSTSSEVFQNENFPPMQTDSSEPILKRHLSSESLFMEKSKRKKWKKQLTLTKAGFTRKKTDTKVHSTSYDTMGSDSETCSNFSFKSNRSNRSLEHSEEPDSTTVMEQSHWSPFKRTQSNMQPFGVSQARSQSTAPFMAPSQQPAMAPTALRVRVQDKLLLVPIMLNNADSLTISWLSKEVSRRYYNIEGVQPSLSLQTLDGALLAEEDPLSLVIGSSELQAIITSWNLPPLGERYIECSHQFKTDVDEHIRYILETSQATHVVDLSNLSLFPNQVQAVFKSLNHQTNITELLLANNCLGNEGMKHLSQCLPTLNHIRKINLSGNIIDSEGVRHLLLAFEKSHTLFINSLDLDLSFNPLGELGFKYLTNLSTYVKLKSLNLCSCDISLHVSDNISVNFQCIEELNLSFNNLPKSVIRIVLDSVNTFTLDVLKLEGLDVSGELLVNIMEDRTYTKLSELDLSRCNLSDSDVSQILRLLTKCENLKTLRLAYNSQLSVLSLKKLIHHYPSLCHIDLEGCPQVFRYHQDTDLQQNWFTTPHGQQVDVKTMRLTVNDEDIVRHFKNMWIGRWGDKGLVEEGIYGELVLNVAS